MHPVVKAAIASAALMGLSLALPGKGEAPPSVAPPPASPAPSLLPMPCPPRHVPEGPACVPLPSPDEPLGQPGDVQPDQRPRGVAVDVVPRLPDRPEDPAAFQFPLPELALLRGFHELGRPDSRFKSPLGIELAAERGAIVTLVELEGQSGPARVVASERLIGNTVITAHTTADAGGRPRVHLLVFGHLEAAGPEVKVGEELPGGAQVGFAGDSGSPGLVRLYLDARRVREGQELTGLRAEQLLEPSTSVPTDLRNVLPLRPQSDN